MRSIFILRRWAFVANSFSAQLKKKILLVICKELKYFLLEVPQPDNLSS
jgi:hypothetical protein